MANQSSTQFSSLINQHADDQENLFEFLLQIEALAQITVTTNFLDQPDTIIHHYLWALSEMVTQARSLCEESLRNLVKNFPGG